MTGRRSEDEELVEAAGEIEALLDLQAWGQLELGPRARTLLIELLSEVERELTEVPV
jgi:hypothetical protein